MKLSSRVESIEISKTVELSCLIDKLKSEGRDIIGLNVGEPDFETPDSIKDATIDAIRNNHTRYSEVAGLSLLREQLGANFSKENVLISNGSKQIIYSVFQTICNPGDEVIILRPYWVTFPESVKLAGGVPIYVDTKDDHQMDIDLIEQAITEKTKAIVINSPNNPSGAVYPKVELEKITALALRHNFFIMADEAYDHLTYNGVEHFPIASISKNVFQNTITVKSFSKTFCMTGFRVGYVVASEQVIQGITRLQSHLSGNTCTFAQFGAIAALELDCAPMLASFQSRSKLAYALFSQIFKCIEPQGAYYLFCDIREYLGDKHKDCSEFTHYILEQAGVAVVPGIAFGQPGFLRISFSESSDILKEAFDRIKKIL
jgi:aspartate aminotransferase